jgi:hypothetical protein
MVINANNDIEQPRAVIARQGLCLESERAGIVDAYLAEAV